MDKKEMVINTARELFIKYGYKKVSMDEIARSSNVTKKTIYTYFKDKEELFMFFVDEELKLIKSKIDKNEKNSTLIDSLFDNTKLMIELKNNSNLLNNLNEIDDKIKNTLINKYDNEILNYIENKLLLAIEHKKIKKCDSHLTAFIIYSVIKSVLLEYDKIIDPDIVSKEVNSILKDGLLN